MGVLRSGHRENLADAVDAGGFGGDRVGGVRQHDDVDGIRLHGGGGTDRARCGGVELAVEVFCDNENLGHVGSPVGCLTAGPSA